MLSFAHLAACNRRDFYQDEKCALISVTLTVAKLLNASYETGGGDHRCQLPSDSKCVLSVDIQFIIDFTLMLKSYAI